MGLHDYAICKLQACVDLIKLYTHAIDVSPPQTAGDDKLLTVLTANVMFMHSTLSTPMQTGKRVVASHARSKNNPKSMALKKDALLQVFLNVQTESSKCSWSLCFCAVYLASGRVKDAFNLCGILHGLPAGNSSQSTR